MTPPRRALVALALALPAVATAAACPDVPTFDGLQCRAAELNQQERVLDEAFRDLTRRIVVDASEGRDACRTGRTGRARRRLRRLRRPLRRAGRRLERLAGRGRVAGVHGRELADLLATVDALRRATAARLVRRACPQLIEVLRPADGEVVDETISVLASLDRRTDGGSFTGAIFAAGRPETASEIAFAQRSRGTAWARLPCPASGPYTVRLRARDGDVLDTAEVTVRCGDDAAVIGADVETLVRPDETPDGLRITSLRPLVSGRTYALAITTGLRATGRRRAVASDDFRRAAGISGRVRRGAVVHWSSALDDPRNPFPDDRLRRADGTVAIPPGYAARAVPSDDRFDGVRAFLARLGRLSEEHQGFSPTVPMVVRLRVPPKIDTATPATVRLMEIRRPAAAATATDLVAALDRERGLAPGQVALAVAFTIEPLAQQLAAVRDQIRARALTTPPVADFVTDPDPTDTRRYGVFRPGDAGFDAFFGGTPPAQAGLVARASFASPDYRVGGRFPPAFLDGSARPPDVAIELLLVRPPDPVPPGGFPTVILQHGFAGDTDFVTSAIATAPGGLLDAGLAVVGIPAPEHGPRGDFFDFFAFTDFNAFGNNFRQASVDLLQLVQLVRAGIDADGDGLPDLAAAGLTYLGVSLGGVIGATVAAGEPDLAAAVLNVPGGQLAQFAGSTSSLALPFLEGFAAEADIAMRTCDGGNAPCAVDEDCAAPATCLLSDDFALLLASALPDFQWQLDPGDGIAYAERLRINPPDARPRPLLVQEGIDDVIVTNPLTEALARAIGLPVGRPDTSPEGVAGLWRFPPPAGHGILALPEVQAQAVAFLASGGTELIAPPGPDDGGAVVAERRSR